MDNNPADPSHAGEEEYQFTEDNTAHKYDAPAATTSASTIARESGKASMKKRVFIILGIVIGVFCLYKLYGLFTVSSSKTTVTPTKQLISAKPSSAPILPKPATPASSPTLTGDKETNLKNQIPALEQNMSQTNQTQENLQTQIGGLSAAITDIQNNVALLTQQISNLTQQKKASGEKSSSPQKAETQNAHPAVTKPRAVKRRSPYFHAMTYYVKALIQGRAWLVDTRGATFTVSQGDQLPGYGTILDIDPDRGMVMTSSGRVISFMPQDR